MADQETVRRDRRRSIAVATISALSASRFAVGSSRTTSGASRRNARASAILWTCPAESGRPPPPHGGLVAVRQLTDEAVCARQRGRRAHLPLVRRGIGKPDIVPHGST